MKILRLILLIIVFLVSVLNLQEALGGDVEIVEFHPIKVDKPKIVKETIEETRFLIRTKNSSIKPSDSLFYTYHYSDCNGTPKDLSMLSFSNEHTLASLKTDTVPDDKLNFATNIYVEVEGWSNEELEKIGSDSKDLIVHRETEVVYNGNLKTVKYHPWDRVSSTINGGNEGVKVSYSESESESKERSFTIKPSFAINVSLINLGFGLDVGQKVTSEKNKTLELQDRIPPHEWGAWYRRCEEIIRIGKVTKWNIIGESSEVAEVYLTDWLFAPCLRTTKNGKWQPLPQTPESD